jgi:hypothetical protein
MYEHRRQPPLSRKAFLARFARHLGFAALMLLIPLTLGMLGYHQLAHFGWADSFLNTCMLLGGMGPVGELPSTSSKIFAAFFALFAGLVFLSLGAFVLAPIFHRVLHKFHWDEDQQSS